jgi:SAM-dependent methyltransferase
MTGGRAHWDRVYGARREEELTWFEAEPEISVRLVSAHAGPYDAILDIGGGVSRLVDALLARGYRDLSVLDISAAALTATRERLGSRADGVRWIEGDVTRWRPDRAYALWHDRAVFHFLTERPARKAYLAAMADALRPGGHAIVATFAEDGPETCSGLPVARWSPEALAAEVDALAPTRFRAVAAERHVHVTPKRNGQRFQVSVFRRA